MNFKLRVFVFESLFLVVTAYLMSSVSLPNCYVGFDILGKLDITQYVCSGDFVRVCLVWCQLHANRESIT